MQERKLPTAEVARPDYPHSRQPYHPIAPQGSASSNAIVPNHRKLVGGPMSHMGAHRKAVLSGPPHCKYKSVFGPSNSAGFHQE